MRLSMTARDVPVRAVTGAFILHSGLDKWHGDDQQAQALHRMASEAYPVLTHLPAARFLRLLAASEIAIGALLLNPFVPNGVAGAALTGFSASLLTMYARTPSLRKPGSIWPAPTGIGISKDVWMLGIGISLVVDSVVRHGS